MRIQRIRPATFVLALIFFCLPWIEIRCNDPQHGLIVTRQSGLQMIYGGTTTTVNGQPLSEAEKQNAAREAGQREKPVPLIILYAACLIMALLGSLVISNVAKRWLFTTISCGVACAALILQIALAFPLVKDIPRAETLWSYTAWFWGSLGMTILSFLVSFGERLVPEKRRSRGS
jgi:hypothetical protein